MLTETTLGEKLKDLRTAKGYKSNESLSSAINIPKTTLNDYENDRNNKDVGYANLVTLAKFYDISMDYLLGLSDVDNHLNTAYSDLGLNDKAIDILKTKSINTRLLSEMIEHKHFADFLANIEIYIDRLASSQINTLNSKLHRAREEIKAQHNPDDKEIYMRTYHKGKYKRIVIFTELSTRILTVLLMIYANPT